jgi:penicillin-binding protein 2
LKESCDTFFYRVGLRLGVERIAKYSRLLGLGGLTGVDLGEEKRGLIPTIRWKKEKLGEEWQEGETLSVAVGQGAVLVTPLQAARMMAVIANGGRLVTPRILSQKRGESTETVSVSRENLDLVRLALADVVLEPGGTAYTSRSEKVSFGGKTGTAQVISEEGRLRLRQRHLYGDHAWFVGFAPVEVPRIVISVLVEHGGFGASAAAPIASRVIEHYMEISGGTSL